ncbi:hypothetical protein QCA50_007403 [Cerrena zonata]|uniref:GST N-terminal domain-containing protein n=1 Tax=Cerrena zonata TaxID=2478898 RepID=A0AAW0G837_9APHY
MNASAPIVSAGNTSRNGMFYHGKQFTVYSDKERHTGPGPLIGLKLLVVLEELNLSYDIIYRDEADAQALSSDSQATLQGFSREQLPVLIDHSKNNRPVWEANTILLYLTEKLRPSSQDLYG